MFPLDDRKFERFNSDLAGRPQLATGSTQMLFGGMGRVDATQPMIFSGDETTDIGGDAEDADPITAEERYRVAVGRQ